MQANLGNQGGLKTVGHKKDTKTMIQAVDEGTIELRSLDWQKLRRAKGLSSRGPKTLWLRFPSYARQMKGPIQRIYIEDRPGVTVSTDLPGIFVSMFLGGVFA
jgi:hypothetical protein